MTWGPQVDFLKLVEQQTGQPNLTLQNRPVLSPNLWYYRDIYAEVSGSRHYSMDGSPLPIPISEVLAYCEMFGVADMDARERLFKMIRTMDNTFREAISKQREVAKKKRP